MLHLTALLHYSTRLAINMNIVCMVVPRNNTNVHEEVAMGNLSLMWQDEDERCVKPSDVDVESYYGFEVGSVTVNIRSCYPGHIRL